MNQRLRHLPRFCLMEAHITIRSQRSATTMANARKQAAIQTPLSSLRSVPINCSRTEGELALLFRSASKARLELRRYGGSCSTDVHCKSCASSTMNDISFPACFTVRNSIFSYSQKAE